MNTAQPVSFPPGPRLSGGISRSTAASTSAASSAVKNIQGPGRTIAGADAVPGFHGMPPISVRARPDDVPATKRAAVETRKERRDSAEGKPPVILDSAGDSLELPTQCNPCNKRTLGALKWFRSWNKLFG